MEMTVKKQTRILASVSVPIIFSILLVVGFTSISHLFNDAHAATSNPLHFAVFSPPAVQSSQLGSQDTTVSFNTGVLGNYPNLHKVLLFFEVTTLNPPGGHDMSSALSTAKSSPFAIDYIGYDPEASNGGLSTPPIELQSLGSYTSQAADAVHTAGFKFETDPTFSALQGSYQSTDWTKVEMLIIQAQRHTSSADFNTVVPAELSWINSRNPNTLIYVQVNPALDTIPNIVNAIKSVKSGIDGVAIVCSTGCSTSILDSLISQLKALDTTTPPSLTAPQSPTGLATNAVSTSQINLSWSAPANNGGSAITGYTIERSNGGSTWSVIISNTGSTGTTYSDTGLVASTAYTYRVSAINAIGTSSPSNTASATTQTPVSPPPGQVSLTIHSVDLSKTRITGLLVTIQSGSTIVATGYTPVTFNVTPGIQYTVTVANNQNYVFNHWANDSTDATRTVTPTGDATMVAWYSP
jgi:hypothetical protein